MHIHVHYVPHPDPRVDQIIMLLQRILKGELKIMATVDDVITAVANEKTVVDSAITLLEQLHTMLTAAIASNDPAKVQAVLDAISTQQAALAAAVSANTPAA